MKPRFLYTVFVAAFAMGTIVHSPADAADRASIAQVCASWVESPSRALARLREKLPWKKTIDTVDTEAYRAWIARIETDRVQVMREIARGEADLSTEALLALVEDALRRQGLTAFDAEFFAELDEDARNRLTLSPVLEALRSRKPIGARKLERVATEWIERAFPIPKGALHADRQAALVRVRLEQALAQRGLFALYEELGLVRTNGARERIRRLWRHPATRVSLTIGLNAIALGYLPAHRWISFDETTLDRAADEGVDAVLGEVTARLGRRARADVLYARGRRLLMLAFTASALAMASEQVSTEIASVAAEREAVEATSTAVQALSTEIQAEIDSMRASDWRAEIVEKYRAHLAEQRGQPVALDDPELKRVIAAMER